MQGINYVHVQCHVRTLVQVVLEEANKHSGTIIFAPEMCNEPVNPFPSEDY